MKNVTNHFAQRWAERIVNVDKNEIKQYINSNRDQIAAHANTTFEYAEFVWKGQLGDNITRNYYIKDDLVFVTNTDDTAFITIYKVDLGYPSDINTYVRKSLLKEMETLRKARDEEEFVMEARIDVKKSEIDNINESMSILEEQMSTYKSQKKLLESEISSLKAQSVHAGIELKKYALMLVNSQEYKRDLQDMK